MANQYTDIKVVECNRLHSEEQKGNNNENYALWTNNLQDIVHLEAGDKVSVYGAMVSERGAGQSSSIEIKGVELGFKKTFNYTKINGSLADPDLPSGFEILTTELVSEDISIRDDTGLFKISYYINMNGHNSISLPRRWWYAPSKTTENFTDYDNRGEYGMSLSDPFAQNDYVLYDDFYQLSGYRSYGEGAGILFGPGLLSKVKNDNSRFTIMVRDNTYYTESSASGNLPSAVGWRDPENAVYHVYEELKSVNIEKGFNSPEYISEEITRQLQSVESETLTTIRNASDLASNPNRPGFPIPYLASFNTETYKSFNCASLYGIDANQQTDLPESVYNSYINGSTNATNPDGFNYLSNYHIVACKRPELYTTGRLININITGNSGIGGSKLAYQYDTIGEPIITNALYNQVNVDLWKNFIDAQTKYPEVWKVFSDSRTPYDDGDTIDNSRWCHINRYANASMTLTGDPAEGAQLGWGGYLRPTWATTTSNLNSVIIPFEYDANQNDIFYDTPDERLKERSYGCFGNASGFIAIYPTTNNGIGSNLFNLLTDSITGPTNIIELGRKIGYDMHFTAPGNTWCLPYSGISQQPISYDSRGAAMTNYIMARNSDPYNLNGGAGTYNYVVSTNNLRGKLYLGADAPRLNWDGTNFSLSDLHTAMNRGNDQANEADWVENVVDADPTADDIVFKINPIEQYGDWTPNRMPYVRDTSVVVNNGGADKTLLIPTLNSNLEAWQIYDALCGINIEDFGLKANEWQGTLWDLLGFSYEQFHSNSNTRLERINDNNVQSLSVITTNASVPEGATKFYSQNMFGTPLYNNMLPRTGCIQNKSNVYRVSYYPPIVVKTESIKIVASRLPTRMIRGYYTIRSNLISDTPFIGGKVDNTSMPIIGIVDKINGDGDFYFGSESSLEFTITKPLRLASLTCSIHDPDGSYANTSEQNTILFKIQKNRNVSFNVAQEILEQNNNNRKK